MSFECAEEQTPSASICCGIVAGHAAQKIGKSLQHCKKVYTKIKASNKFVTS